MVSKALQGTSLRSKIILIETQTLCFFSTISETDCLLTENVFGDRSLNSLPTLLIHFAGSTDLIKELCNIQVIYLNPLLGGSYYSDGFMGSGRYSIFYPLVRPFAVDNLIRDLKPESFFQQVIFGENCIPSCLAANSYVIVTEPDEAKTGITKARFNEVFGKTRSQAILQMGKRLILRNWLHIGHQGPLVHPEIVVPYIPDSLRRGTESIKEEEIGKGLQGKEPVNF